MQHIWIFNNQVSFSSGEYFKELFDQKQIELGIFLSYYYKKNGAVAENVTLKSDPEFESETSGSLVFEFDLVHFNSCLAIHEKAHEEFKVSYKIDIENQQLKLIGPAWPGREMDEI